MGFIQTGRQVGRGRTAKRLKFATRKPQPAALPDDLAPSSLSPSSSHSLAHTVNGPDLSILERLPVEIMMGIFLEVGLDGNELHFANKYFFSLFDLKYCNQVNGGIGFVEKLIRRHFTFDLNANFNLDVVTDKVLRYRDRFLTANSPASVSTSFDELQMALEYYKENATAVAAEFFNRRFVSDNFLAVTGIRYRKVLSRDTIAQETTQRSLYIRRGLKGLIEKLKTQPETELETMALVAQEQFDGAIESPISTPEAFAADDELKDYSPTNIALFPDFPARFYSWSYSSSYILMVRSLSQHFQFKFHDINRILQSCIRKYRPQHGDLVGVVREIYSLEAEESAALLPEPIIECFILLSELGKDALCVLETVELLLSKYYGSDSTREDDDIWIYLGQSKDIRYLEIVSKYAGPPGAHAMRLLGL